jgi:DNA-binding NarL/FixJ family response regulator
MTTKAKKSGRDTIRIVLVEDDAGTLRSLERMLATDSRCLCVGGFRRSADATDSLPRVRPDVVLVDVNLPDGTGVDVVRTLSPVLPETEFVMLTIYQDGDILFDALSAGAHGYLIKPVRTEQLLAAIHDVLEGGAPMSNVVARKIVRSFESDKPLPPPEPLGPREREVLELLAAGAMYKEVAKRLGISINTVLTYVRRIYRKLHVNSRHAAVDRFKKMR